MKKKRVKRRPQALGPTQAAALDAEEESATPLAFETFDTLFQSGDAFDSVVAWPSVPVPTE